MESDLGSHFASSSLSDIVICLFPVSLTQMSRTLFVLPITRYPAPKWFWAHSRNSGNRWLSSWFGQQGERTGVVTDGWMVVLQSGVQIPDWVPEGGWCCRGTIQVPHWVPEGDWWAPFGMFRVLNMAGCLRGDSDQVHGWRCELWAETIDLGLVLKLMHCQAGPREELDPHPNWATGKSLMRGLFIRIWAGFVTMLSGKQPLKIVYKGLPWRSSG